MYLDCQYRYDYINYCTRYSVTGSLPYSTQGDACFHHVYRNLLDDMDNTYRITIFPFNIGMRYRLNNNCPFNDRQILHHLKELNRFYPVDISIEHKDYIIYITLHIANAPATFHKYALGWTRYLYEFPYNELLRDAYRLKHDELSRVPIHTIMNLMICCCASRLNGEHHLIPKNTFSFTSHKALREAFKYATTNFDLWKDKMKLRSNEVPNYHIPSCINEKANDGSTITEKFSSFSYWDSVYFIKYRKPIYLKTYKMFKERTLKKKSK